MRNALTVKLFLAAAGFVAAASAQTNPRDYEAYLAELNDPGAQFVVVSNHFRHDVGCTSRGCILMGPTADQQACKDWASAYNTIDPLDHARCVESVDYESVRY